MAEYTITDATIEQVGALLGASPVMGEIRALLTGSPNTPDATTTDGATSDQANAPADAQPVIAAVQDASIAAQGPTPPSPDHVAQLRADVDAALVDYPDDPALLDAKTQLDAILNYPA